MKLLALTLPLAIAGSLPLWAQRTRPGPPPSEPGTYTTTSGTISQLNYNREGDVEGFLLGNKTVVHLPPRAAVRADALFTPGDRVDLTGYASTSPSGFQLIEAQTIQDRTKGRSLNIPVPGQPAPYSSRGTIRQLNYDARGAVNGFLLDNGTLGLVPPFSAANPSMIRPGETIQYTGFATQSMNGRTIVNVQTLAVNGQTITLAAPPEPPAQPAAPTRRRGPGADPGAPAGNAPQPPPPPSAPDRPANPGSGAAPPVPPPPPE